jgi:hypothetical protein
MGTSPDEDLTSYVHIAHGLEVSSQTNRLCRFELATIPRVHDSGYKCQWRTINATAPEDPGFRELAAAEATSQLPLHKS